MGTQRGYLISLFLVAVMVAFTLGNLARGDTFADVMTKTQAAICVVRGHNGGPEKHIGTGCLIGPALVLSADHVLEDCQYAECVFGAETIQAKTEYRSASCDSVLVVLERSPSVQPLQISPGISNPRGEIYLAGFRGGQLRYFDGVGDGRQWKNQQGQLVLSVVSDTQQGGEPGNSGGPAFDGQGRVLGNISSSNWANGPRNNTMVVHPRTLQKFLQRVEQRYPGTCPPGYSCPPSAPAPRPTPQPQPQCEIDYAKLIEMIAADPRFRGKDGKDGTDGRDGTDGVQGPPGIPGNPGASAVIDYDKLAAEVIARLPVTPLQPMTYDQRGNLIAEGSPINLRIGQETPLPPVVIESNPVDGQPWYSVNALGQPVPIWMDRLQQ